MLDIRANEEGVTFAVVVQPRASKVAIVGRHQNALKIRLTAPPVDNAANKQCIAVLAKTLGRPKSTIEIVGGQTSRQKQVRIRPRQGKMDAAEQSELVAALTRIAR
jgi:uncharacterized protein (TIGR00251 family)